MSFSADLFRAKLSNLSESSQSIQTLSHWVQFHKKAARDSAGVWAAEAMRAPSATRRLLFVYLANDIMQNSRRKGPEFVKEYGAQVGRVLPKMHADAAPPIQAKLVRMLGIWDERRVLGTNLIAELRARLGAPASAAPSAVRPSKAPPPPADDDDDEYIPAGGDSPTHAPPPAALGALAALAALGGGAPAAKRAKHSPKAAAPPPVPAGFPPGFAPSSPAAASVPTMPLADLLLSFDEGSLVDELQAEREADLELPALANVSVTDPSQIGGVTKKADAAMELLTAQRAQLIAELGARRDLILLLATSAERQHAQCEALSAAVAGVDEQLSTVAGAQAKVATLKAQMDSITDAANEAM